MSPLPGPWQGWHPATCMPDACFCEQVRPGYLRQPVNAFSGLAFLLVAALLLRTPRRHAYTVPYAAALAVVGVGTVFYHASLTFWGQTADVLGMYLLVTLLVLHGATCQPGRRAWLGYALGNLVLLGALVGLPALRRYLFALLVAAALALQLRRARWHGGGGFPAGALAVLAVGFTAWTLDLTRVLCAPTSLLQGHAFWHLCGAVAAGLAYRTLRPS